MLEKFGKCVTCKATSPLTKDEYCPKCRWPIAAITYKEAYQNGTLSILEVEGYLPVTGWTSRGHITLYGYVHLSRSREGWSELFKLAKRDKVGNLILGEPEKILSKSV